jgi:DedD protein
MANASKRSSSGDVVLESRHLVGLFVLMVVIFGVVFVLGYELGRNQYGGQVRAAAEPPDENTPASASDVVAVKSSAQPAAHPPAAKPQPAKSSSTVASTKAAPGASPPADYDFYKLGQPKQPPAPNKNGSPAGTATVKAAAPKTQPAPVKAANSPTSAMNAPLIPHGSFLLQVAALTKESDALALAQALEKKKFSAIVIPPGADRFYHVQVGPYADAKSADAGRKALEDAGFKAIVKH